MVSLRERMKGERKYYYLEHTLREDGNITKKEIYLGTRIPANIEERKKIFLEEIYSQKWFTQFNKIKSNFIKEKKNTPFSAEKKELENFIIKFTYNTQRIEGSTLTLRETANLLENGISPKEKPLSDSNEAEAHRQVFYEMLSYKKELSLQIILYWHKKLFENTKKDIAGKLREHGVGIAGSKFIPPFPVEVYPNLVDFFSWYRKNKDKLHPVELAALVHLKFVTIHPFADGNGRISRILMNFILKKGNFPFLDIPYHNRSSYYTALERSQIKKEERIFVQWFFRRYKKECKRFAMKRM